VLSPSSFPGTTGDTANYSELIEGIARLGIGVKLICPSQDRSNEFDRRIRSKGVEILRVPVKPPRLISVKKDNRMLVEISCRFALFCLVEVLITSIILGVTRHRYVLVRHSLLTIILAPFLSMLRTKSIADGDIPCNISDLGFNMPKALLSIFLRFEKCAVSSYRFFLASTSSQLKPLKEIGLSTPQVIIKNVGINTKKVPVYDLNRIPELTCGYFGALEKWQSLDLLIRSWAEVIKEKPAAKLFIIGNGSLEVSLKRLAKDLGITGSIIFLNGVCREELWKDFFPHFRFALITRSPDYFPENASIKLVEALASGKPIIATKVKGIQSMVSEGEGVIFVEPNNIRSLTSAILNLFNDDVLSFDLSKKAVLTSDRFNIDKQIYNLLNLLFQQTQNFK
jgi:glycosyltransferase involved in cell wall biosynthesis